MDTKIKSNLNNSITDRNNNNFCNNGAKINIENIF